MIKFNCIYEYFYHLEILTKSATPGDFQTTFAHSAIGNTPLRENVTKCYLKYPPESPTVVLFDTERAFSSAGSNISLPITEVDFLSSIWVSEDFKEAPVPGPAQRYTPPTIPC